MGLPACPFLFHMRTHTHTHLLAAASPPTPGPHSLTLYHIQCYCEITCLQTTPLPKPRKAVPWSLPPAPFHWATHLDCLSPPHSCAFPTLRTSSPLIHPQITPPCQEHLPALRNFCVVWETHHSTPVRSDGPPWTCVFPKGLTSAQRARHVPSTSYSHDCLQGT